MNEKILKTLRAMAWERAKGELNAMLETLRGADTFAKLDTMIYMFIQKVNENGYLDS